MAETSSDRHGRLSREFVMKLAGETQTQAELMVVIESTILATMLLSHKIYGMTPGAAAEMVESAVHRATERFAAQEGK